MGWRRALRWRGTGFGFGHGDAAGVTSPLVVGAAGRDHRHLYGHHYVLAAGVLAASVWSGAEESAFADGDLDHVRTGPALMDYQIVKWLHVLSSTLLFGTGLGSAFYMFFASCTRDPKVIAVVVRHVVVADWLFTATSVVFQPLSGFYLAYLAGFPLNSRWIVWSIMLYLVAGACWLPVVWMQIRMRDMAVHAIQQGQALPPLYQRYLKRWVLLGIPAFGALVAVFYLMVAKPV